MKSQTKVFLFVAFVVLAVVGIVAVSSYIQQNTAPADSSASAYNGFKLSLASDPGGILKVGDTVTVNLSTVILTAQTGAVSGAQTAVLGEAIVLADGGTCLSGQPCAVSGGVPAPTPTPTPTPTPVPTPVPSKGKYNSAEVIISFDPKALQASDIALPDTVLAARKTQDNTKGVINIDLAKLGGLNFTDNEQIATIKFKVKAISKEGTTVVKVSTASKFGVGTPALSPSLAAQMSLFVAMKPRCLAIPTIPRDFCRTGRIIQPGPDANGCPKPPTCGEIPGCTVPADPICKANQSMVEIGKDNKGCSLGKRCVDLRCYSATIQVVCPSGHISQAQTSQDVSGCPLPPICVPPTNPGACNGANNCTATCVNGKTFADSCPADGAFPTCKQWASEACAKNSGVLNFSGNDSTTCKGASKCTTSCKDGSRFSDVCPADGAFKSCSAWATEACVNKGGVATVNGDGGVVCPGVPRVQCPSTHAYQTTYTANGCEAPGHCIPPTCPPVATPICKGGSRYVSGNIVNGCQQGGTCVPVTCPQYSPAPGYCSGGKLISGGVDANGCQLPPKCDMGTDINCTFDAKRCADGSYVSRDPKNNCQFRTCPVVPPRECSALPPCAYLTGPNRCSVPTVGFWCPPKERTLPESCRSDFDGSGTVDAKDLAKFAASYKKTVACTLDIVKAEGQTACVFDINDLIALATIYKQENVCKK